MLSIDAVLDRAAHLLGNRFGGTPELTHPEDLGGSSESVVLRVKVTPNPFLQERTVVIKQLPPVDATASDGATAETAQAAEAAEAAEAAMISEVVAYQYTNTLAEENRPGPLLLAHDIDQRVMVLSDAGDGTSYADILSVDGDEKRRSALRKLGRALGRMQVATADGEEAFNTLNRRQYSRHGLPADRVDERDVDVAALVEQGLGLLRRSGIEVSDTVAEFAAEAGQRQQRSRLRAFTPFDLTPDNIMLTDRVDFLDFEWAGFRDIVSDVACVVAGFPHDTATPLLDDGEIREFIDAWSSEVVAVWPDVRRENELAGALVTSLIGWALMSLSLLYHGTLAVIANAGGAEEGARRLDRMPETHLADLATTIESIRRFSLHAAEENPDDPRYPDVTGFAAGLLEKLAGLGAYPQIR